MPNNRKPIEVVCAECGSGFTVPMYHYKRYTTEGKSFYCKECYKKHRAEISRNYWKNLDEAKKKEMIDKSSAARRNTSDDKKAAFRKKIKATWANKSEEEKAEYANRCSEHSKQFWESLNPSKREELINHMTDAQRKYFSELSDEDKNRRATILREAAWKYWESLDDNTREAKIKALSEHSRLGWENSTEEQRRDRSNKIRKGRKKYWANMSEEDRIKFGEQHHEWWQSLSKEERSEILAPMHAGYEEWYKNLSPEELIQLSANKSKYSKQFWDSLSDEERDDVIRRQNEGYQKYYDSLKFVTEPNKNEAAFENILKLYNFDFMWQYQNRSVYPDFHKLFPGNKELGIKYVSPYHKWDYIVKTRDSNILVDVDGSVHDQTGKNGQRVWKVNSYNKIVDVKKLTEFYDSQRKYKTDGLPAYIILCYDNNLTNDTTVVNIDTNQSMKLENFIAYLRWLNYTDEEKSKIAECAL